MTVLVPILINPILAGLAFALVYLVGILGRRPFNRHQLWDGTLVLVLIAIAQEEIWFPRYSFNNRVGPTGLALAATTALALLLLWRRTRPLLVLTAIATITVVRALLGGGVTGLGFVGPILVAAYSVGRHERRLPWPLGAAASAVLAVGSTLFDSLLDPTHGTSPGFMAFTFLIMGVLWGMGRLLQTRESMTAALADRAEALERDREARAREAVTQERARIARELHDVVAHNVSVILLQAQAASAVLDERPESARKPIQRIEATAREAMAEMRHLVGILEEGDHLEVGPQPGLAQLPELVGKVRESGLEVDFKADGELADLPAGPNLAAYRVVQEALTNVLKHAGAQVVRVQVRRTNGGLDVEVVDDGGGGPSASDNGGRGLIGMRQRVTLYGGSLEAGRQAGGGFAIKAVIPLQGMST